MPKDEEGEGFPSPPLLSNIRRQLRIVFYRLYIRNAFIFEDLSELTGSRL